MIKQHALCVRHCPKNPVNYLKTYNIPMNNCYFYHHFAEEDTETQRSNWLKITQSVSGRVVIEPRRSGSGVHDVNLHVTLFIQKV